MNGKRISLLVLGVLIPIAIGVISVALEAGGGGASANAFASIEWWQILVCIPVGYVVGITQVVPGLSATAVIWLSAGLPPSWTASALRSGSRIP